MSANPDPLPRELSYPPPRSLEPRWGEVFKLGLVLLFVVALLDYLGGAFLVRQASRYLTDAELAFAGVKTPGQVIGLRTQTYCRRRNSRHCDIYPYVRYNFAARDPDGVHTHAGEFWVSIDYYAALHVADEVQVEFVPWSPERSALLYLGHEDAMRFVSLILKTLLAAAAAGFYFLLNIVTPVMIWRGYLIERRLLIHGRAFPARILRQRLTGGRSRRLSVDYEFTDESGRLRQGAGDMSPKYAVEDNSDPEVVAFRTWPTVIVDPANPASFMLYPGRLSRIAPGLARTG